MAQQTAPTLSRQGSVVRSDAIAKLKRAASQREVRANPIPTLQRSETVKQPPAPLVLNHVQDEGANVFHYGTGLSSAPSTRAITTSDGYLSPHTNDVSLPSVTTPGASPTVQSHGSSELVPSPARSPAFPKDRTFNRSPLPSLEQLRARILQERETAGTSSSAASQAARAYALEKLLGNSGEDIFSGQNDSHFDGNAATSSHSQANDDLEDMASDDENRSDLRTRRQSVVQRPSLRRSMSVNSLSSMADTQRKVGVAQGGFLLVPGAASNRISRIRQRRTEQDSTVPTLPLANLADNVSDQEVVTTVSELGDAVKADSDLARAQSQRQIARTQLLRKLSTRGRGAPAARETTPQTQPDIAVPSLSRTDIDGPDPLRSPEPKAPSLDNGSLPPTISPATMHLSATSSPNMKKDETLSPLPQIPAHRSPASDTKQSSQSFFSDEEELADDDFYKLYSPAIGYDDDPEDDEPKMPGFSDTAALMTNKRDEQSAVKATLVNNRVMPPAPSTPPQRFPYRDSAAVPYDPSPGTDTDFGDLRRSHWMSASPSGVTVPLRFSDSLISSPHDVQLDSIPPHNPKSPNKGRGAGADWPISISSAHTLLHTRESLESGAPADARASAPYQESLPSSYSASPALHSSDDKQVDAHAEPKDRLAVPTLRAKPSERLQAILGSSFVQEYANDLNFDNRSKSSLAGDSNSADEREMRRLDVRVADSSRLSPSHQGGLKDDLSDVDADDEVDDAYLRKVDRIADKLRRLAKPTMVTRLPSVRRDKPEPKEAGQIQKPTYEPAIDMAVPRAATVPQPAVMEAGTVHSRRELPSANRDRPDFAPGMAQRMREQLQDEKKASPQDTSHDRPLPDPPSSLAEDTSAADTSHGSSQLSRDIEQRPGSPGRELGLFSSLRRKASSLRRNPSSAKDKEGGGFWSRRNAAAKAGESPKMPSEATFISAPIMVNHTLSGSSFTMVPTSGPTVRSQIPMLDQSQTIQTGDESELMDLQRNGSVSSVGSARIHPDLQDGTADNDTAATVDQTAAAFLGPGAAAVIHRYSRMLTASNLSTPVPGVTMQHTRDPPRKFIMAEPVFQVISATTIKDRYLFLLSDLLIIAKPVASPDNDVSKPFLKMKEANTMPSLEWKFAVKNILELHRLKVNVTSSTRTATAKTRAQNPVLWSFVKQFSQDTDAAVRTLTGKTGLNPSSTSIAQVLYQTPELDRTDLTWYITQPHNRQLLKEYVGQHRQVGVSIESALRSLLLDLRFPTELDAFEALLMNFSYSWTSNNASTIKANFTVQLASDLVFAIMALNDALYTDSTISASASVSPNFPRSPIPTTPGLFSTPCHGLSKEDFVHVFRQHDQGHVLSDRTLSRIYLSIRSEPLVQAVDRHEPRFTIRIKGGKLPTRMTYAQPAEPVTLVIPAPDPDLAIRLYAQDTTFEPPVLTFSHSREASFTMWSKHLGPKQVVFVRTGRNARYYTGTETDVSEVGANDGLDQDAPPLPRSFNVTVERAFMKHSFTLSSAASGGEDTKRFMFSFENGDKVATWTSHIKAQIETCMKEKAAAVSKSSPPDSAVQKRATEAIALQVLRDSLVVQDDFKPAANIPVSNLDRSATVTGMPNSAPLLPHHFRSTATQHAGTSYAPEMSSTTSSGLYGGANHLGHQHSTAGESRLMANNSVLDRAPSTSRHYYAASGVGRHERELLIPPSASSASMMSGSSSSGQLHNLAMGGTGPRQQHQHHTKSSASLSVYPPSSAVKASSFDVMRAKSTRSASATTQQRQASATRPPADPSSHRQASNANANPVDKHLPGTQIVSIARLNSLLSAVLAHHQSQSQPQSQPASHRQR